MSERRPNPAVTNPCPECAGWGVTTVRKGTDWEYDELCLTCHGTGTRTNGERR